MTNFKKTLVAAALALTAASVQAAPVFGEPGYTLIKFENYENLYRQVDTSGACVGCLARDANDPAGWAKVDPSIANNVKAGDVFAGILNVQNIDDINGQTWSADISGSNKDQFTGYFAQQVTNVFDPATYTGVGSTLQEDIHMAGTFSSLGIITLDNVTVDPFGILDTSADEVIRLYADSGAAATVFTKNGTVASGIATATDGTLWASLTNEGGYMYSHSDLASSSASNITVDSYSGMNIVLEGAAYNLGELDKVNSVSEVEAGGPFAPAVPSFVCTPAMLVAGAVCTDFVLTSTIQINESGAFGTLPVKNSPWIFRSDDPIEASRIPEPGTLALLGLGLMGLAGLRRRAA